jgi:hypothetical protein
MKRAVFGLFVAAFVAIPRVASAYCQARACDTSNPADRCQIDDDDCVTSGSTLFWASSCVTFAVQRDGSREQDIGADEVLGIASRAFSHWLSSDCGGEAPSLQVGMLGLVACDQSEYNPEGRNANVIMFRDEEWPYPGAIDTYAYTVLRFDPNTGELRDADIEINTAEFEISTDPEDGIDLESILTHEVGHFLGLAHAAPADDDATMAANWNGEGTALRSLSADDGDGMCATYPPDRQATTSSCDPRNGFASECGVPVSAPDESGCSISRVPSKSHDPMPVALSALMLGLTLRRRAKRRMGRRC